MLDNNNTIDLNILPSVDITAEGLSEEEIQAQLQAQGEVNKPLLLFVRKKVLTVSKSVSNKRNLELKVNNEQNLLQAVDALETIPQENVAEKAEETQKIIDLTAISLSKKIIVSELYKAITTHDAKTSNLIRNRYAVPPHYNRGLFLIPLPLVFKVQEFLQERMQERMVLINNFIQNYDTIIADMQRMLKNLFNFNDYPSQKEVLSKFDFSYRFFNFDTPLSLKSVNLALYEKESKESELYWENIRKEVKTALTVSYKQLIGHMLNQLKSDDNDVDLPEGKKKRYNRKSIQNIINFIDSFTSKNSVAGDSNLAKLVEDSRAILDGIDVNQINRDDNVTNTIVSGFSAIEEKLNESIEEFNVAERKFDIFDSIDTDGGESGTYQMAVQ